MAESLLNQLLARTLDAGSTWANAAILGKDKATEIAIRATDQDAWSRLNGSGPNDRAGAASDAKSGPVETRGLGSLLGGNTALIAAGLALAVVLVFMLFRRR